MSGHKDKPLHRRGDLTTGRPCTKCKRPFDLLHWQPSKWTLSGWLPWCPQCAADLGVPKDIPVRRGPKPGAKRLREMTWTNLPE